MLHRDIHLSILLACLCAVPTSAADKVTYETDVQPILREHCFACHNQDDATASLALDSYEGALAGGAGGEVLAAGDADGSRLWKLVTHQESPTMPPGDKLPDPQLNVLRSWIEGGLLKNADSKPLKSDKPQIAKIDPANLGKPIGAPAMPEQLFHEPVLCTPHVGPVDALATSPWAPLAAIAWQRQVSFYDTNTFSLLGILPYVEGVPRVVRFSRDGSLLLVAGGRHAAAGSAALFDVKTGARLATLGDELDIVLAADVSPDLSLVALGGPKKKVRVYRVADGQLAYDIGKHTDWITALGFSPDGQFLATADRSGGAFVWQATAGLERAELRGHSGRIAAIDWRSDSAMLATASEDGTARLWNSKGQQIKSINAHGGGVLAVRFAADGNWITTGRDRHVKTWKPDGNPLADLGAMPGIGLAATFTHDSTKAIASDYSGEVRVIDVATKQPITTLAANPPTLAHRFAAAEASLKQSRKLVKQAVKNEATRLAALEQGESAHAAHEKKLGDSQAAAEKKQQALATLTESHAHHEDALAAARKSQEQTASQLAEATQKLEAAQASEAEQPADDPWAELKTTVEEARVAEAEAHQKVEQGEAELKTLSAQRQAAEDQEQKAAAILAKVANETAGLPNLEKLKQLCEDANVARDAAQQQMQRAEQAQAAITQQQKRFAAATEQLANKTQSQQAKLQQVSAQTQKLAAEHQRSAEQLAQQVAQRKKIAQQLETLQKQFKAIQSTESASKAAATQLATELAGVQAAQTLAEQQIERIEALRRDLAAAEELRKRYAGDKQ